MDLYQIENDLDNIKHRPIYNDIERVDKAINIIFKAAIKKVEGMR